MTPINCMCSVWMMINQLFYIQNCDTPLLFMFI